MKILFLEANAITLELENDLFYYSKDCYDIYVNDKYYSSKMSNVFSVFGLKPNEDYTIKADNEEITFRTPDKKFIEFNASHINDVTEELNKAIENLKSNEILFINGIYNITSIEIFDSNKTIYFGPNTVIVGETRREKYKIFDETDEANGVVLGTWEGKKDKAFYSTITIVGAKNVTLYGPGLIDSNANNSDWWVDHRVKRIARRPKGIFIHTSENVSLVGLTLKNTASWAIHPFYSKDINVIDMKIINPANSPTTDGCDPEACDNVNIIGNYISVGDDCIAIKSSKIELARLYHRPSTNIIIRNNLMNAGHAGVCLGSENSGGINNVVVENCYFNETDRGLRVKSQRGRGKDAIIKNIVFRNIYMNSVKAPFVINAFYKAGNDVLDDRFDLFPHPIDDTTPSFGEFTFEHIKCSDVSYGLAFFMGLPESTIKKVTLSDVEVSYNKNAKPGVMAMTAKDEKFKNVGFVLRNIDTLELDKVSFKNDPDMMYIKDDKVKILLK